MILNIEVVFTEGHNTFLRSHKRKKTQCVILNACLCHPIFCPFYSLFFILYCFAERNKKTSREADFIYLMFFNILFSKSMGNQTVENSYPLRLNSSLEIGVSFFVLNSLNLKSSPMPNTMLRLL